jgi:hypothetical protein
MKYSQNSTEDQKRKFKKHIPTPLKAILNRKLVKISIYLDEIIKALESRYLLETKWISFLIRNCDTFICVLVTIHRFTDGFDGGICDYLINEKKTHKTEVT